MKIINWNVGRPSKAKVGQIITELDERDADILILTETNSLVIPTGRYNLISTNPLTKGHDGVQYKDGEYRVSIWTRFPITQSHKTFDSYTSVCADIETLDGLLTIYATIMGVFGGKSTRFDQDLGRQLSDFENLFPGRQICIAGDYNVTFSGYPYPSHSARENLNYAFKKLMVTNLTSSIENCVDHVAISNDFLQGKKVTIDKTWNTDKSLSDHVGTSVTLKK